MSRPDGFLSRWSRLKQEAARPAPPPPAVPDEAARAAREAEQARMAAIRAEEEAREREALLARLPKLEDLRADSDFSQFMHPLVPSPLRSAALSRLWSLDAAIRGYEDPARDYAWNWNVPGGVPGGGPAPSSEEVQSTLREIFKRLDSEERVDEPARPDPADEPATAGRMADAPPAVTAPVAPAAPPPWRRDAGVSAPGRKALEIEKMARSSRRSAPPRHSARLRSVRTYRLPGAAGCHRRCALSLPTRRRHPHGHIPEENLPRSMS